MIKVLDEYFILETKDTSYIFYKEKYNHLFHLYYGKKVEYSKESLDSMRRKHAFPIGNDIKYNKEKDSPSLEFELQEISTRGKGDLRNPMIEIESESGFRSSDFVFESYEIGKVEEYKTLPSSKPNNNEALFINLKDLDSNIAIKIAYNVFEDTNVITRQMWIKNVGDAKIKLIKAYSMNLDMDSTGFNLKSFHGSWASEMNMYDEKLVMGSYIHESLAGTSSSRCNPFFIVYKDGTNEENGETYGFNLIYSGNHRELVEIDYYKHMRILSGINPETFSFILNKDEVFEVPEAIMSYSNGGFNSLSHNFHEYIKNHIIEEEFRNFPRKVLNNSWEACYFNFKEPKLLSMARCAKKLGVELFVLDDGWFGERLDDTRGLGDWVENNKKLKSGLRGFSDKLKKIGMEFGIWVEPEMVNENSSLFRCHKDWVLMNPNYSHSLGRNQMILDLSNKEVEDYLFDSMSYVFSEANCTYVKWDMNRIFSDYYSQSLESERMLELNHRYYLGFYSLVKRLKERFPHILFEGCASGGNRFDLGILSYFPQIWASDNTDPFSRINMQYNYSYGYPISTLGCHTASSPCLNTLRRSSLDVRFNAAFMGAFGYEIDLREESRKSKKLIKSQIEYYKSIRDKIIDSEYYRIRRDENYLDFECLSKDKTLGFIADFMIENKPINSEQIIKVYGLDEKKDYKVYARRSEINIKELGGAINYVSPIHIKDGGIIQGIISKFYKMKDSEFLIKTNGSTLNNNGLTVNESFAGAGIDNSQRIMRDHTSKLYEIKEINN